MGEILNKQKQLWQ